ncbi:conjugative transposon protein TraN [Arcicella sp. LKC2W]|uniref:conjugative transposon protein TraN n=1 Tax=Arcicella sp. LKC2W TaxID=2984198 RepID=UPI002B215699|nr:conjugative transposon protein TraN [Arcicella sp. LKC2W]MEA5461636.1 conjugative transposon protein TraN [Arcicella sp. LKC2W]
MKFKYMLGLSCVLLALESQGQKLSVIPKDSLSASISSLSRQKRVLEFKENNIKGSYPLSVAFYKTSHIVFDSPVKYFDAGSDRVICEKVTGVENVLKVKANQIGFFESNVTVITANGSYYSFVISYNESPNKLNVNMCNGLNETFDYNDFTRPEKIIFSDTYYTETEMIVFAKKVILQGKSKTTAIRHIAEKSGKVAFKVTSLATKEGNIIIGIKMNNRSPLDYTMDFMKFYIRDKARRKKQVSQEVELKPSFAYVERNGISNEAKLGVSGGEFDFVFMIPKFSISQEKQVEIDIAEKDGGRNMTLKLDYETFYYQMNRL